MLKTYVEESLANRATERQGNILEVGIGHFENALKIILEPWPLFFTHSICVLSELGLVLV